MSIELNLNNSGAASPDDIPQGEKVHPFQQFSPDQQLAVPASEPPADENLTPPPLPQPTDENDTSEFDTNNALARLFAIPSDPGTEEQPPAPTIDPSQQTAVTQQGAHNAPAPQNGVRASGEKAGKEGDAQAPAEQITGLNADEQALINNFRQGDLSKKLQVLEQFEQNPVAFVDKYAPEIRQAVVERAASDVLSPEQFAQQWAEVALEQKYGNDFEFNPADVAIRGTASEQFFTDKQLFLAEGARRYTDAQQQKNAEQLANRQRVEQAARKVLVEQGFNAAQYDEVIRIAESLPSTPETYYEMLFTFLRAKGLVAPTGVPVTRPAASQTHTAGKNLPPNTQTVAGKTSAPVVSNEAKNLVDLFGADLL